MLEQRAASLWTIAREQLSAEPAPATGKAPHALSEDARKLVALNMTVSAKGFEAFRCVFQGLLLGAVAVLMFVMAGEANRDLFGRIVFVIMGIGIGFFAASRIGQLGLKYVFAAGKLTCLGLTQKVLWKEDLASVVEVRAISMYRGPRYVKIVWPKRQRTIPFVNWWLDT